MRPTQHANTNHYQGFYLAHPQVQLVPPTSNIAIISTMMNSPGIMLQSIPSNSVVPAAHSIRSKRRWDAWSEIDIESFFDGINKYGVREFSKIAQGLGTKTREQVSLLLYTKSFIKSEI